MAQLAHFSFPYYFTIPNSEFRIPILNSEFWIPKFVEQTGRLLLLFISILQAFEWHDFSQASNRLWFKEGIAVTW